MGTLGHQVEELLQVPWILCALRFCFCVVTPITWPSLASADDRGVGGLGGREPQDRTVRAPHGQPVYLGTGQFLDNWTVQLRASRARGKEGPGFLPLLLLQEPLPSCGWHTPTPSPTLSLLHSYVRFPEGSDSWAVQVNFFPSVAPFPQFIDCVWIARHINLYSYLVFNSPETVSLTLDYL